MVSSKHPTWFGRFKSYPLSVLGHIAQGVLAGAAVGSDIGWWWFSSVWFLGFVAYQGLSFARKVSTEGRGDTAGLDSFDFVVGALPAFAIANLIVDPPEWLVNYIINPLGF